MLIEIEVGPKIGDDVLENASPNPAINLHKKASGNTVPEVNPRAPRPARASP
jgi:hypothetical protein